MRRLLLAVIASAVLSIAGSAASARNDAQSGPAGRIAFSVRHWTKNSDNWEIFLMTVSGRSSANLTRNPRCSEISPAWSHDGDWIAFACASWLGRPGGIHVIRTDGSGRRPVVRLPKRRVDDPAWAPGDGMLAFAYARVHSPGGTGIWTVGIDGEGLRRLTRGRDGSPTWSPDGRELAFDRKRGEQLSIFRIHADRTGRRRIAMNASGPVWSPDGLTIAFIRNGDAWLMSPSGGSQRRLARVRGPNGIGDLAWSPDGRYLAFYVSCCRESGIYVIGADGTGRRRLSYGPEQLGIAWGPDS